MAGNCKADLRSTVYRLEKQFLIKNNEFNLISILDFLLPFSKVDLLCRLS